MCPTGPITCWINRKYAVLTKDYYYVGLNKIKTQHFYSLISIPEVHTEGSSKKTTGAKRDARNPNLSLQSTRFDGNSLFCHMYGLNRPNKWRVSSVMTL